MRGLYVDDGRGIIEKLKHGMRFDKTSGKVEFREEWAEEDSEITIEDLTEREYRAIMNSINPDLRFTTETEKQFETGRLPTLAFEIWSEKNGVRHSFFEKQMRSQIMTMARSSQSENSKISISVNELNRRLDMMDSEVSDKEKVDEIDHYVQQLINSEYSIPQIRDIVLSSIRGKQKKERLLENQDFRFRSAEESLDNRIKKKLLESTSWYKENPEKERSIDEEKDIERNRELMQHRGGTWKKYRQANKRKRDDKEETPTGVFFVQHTLHSKLAKNIRERLSKLEESSGRLKIKIVERSGLKLTDLLHKSNAWSSRDCMREDCLMCKTAENECDKGKCYRRNIMYETFCITCQENIEKENVEKDAEGTEREQISCSKSNNEHVPNIESRISQFNLEEFSLSCVTKSPLPVSHLQESHNVVEGTDINHFTDSKSNYEQVSGAEYGSSLNNDPIFTM